MKKLLPFTIIAIILMSFSAKSQYNQMLKDGNKWIVNEHTNYSTEVYMVDSDTIIFNQTWKKIKMISNATSNPVYSVKFFLREDTLTKKVYAMNPGQAPHLYFDFSVTTNDTLMLYNLEYNEMDTFFVKNTGTVMTADSIYRNSYYVKNSQSNVNDHWIEGVGSLNGIYYGNMPPYVNSFFYQLLASCYNNNLVYRGPDLPSNICNINIGITETNPTTPNIYPNPATDFLQIENISDKTVIAIYSIDGKLQKSLTVPENGIVKIKELAEGIYFIKFQNEKGIVCKKFIKNKQ